MEFTLLHREISDLCLGKPALRSLSISATVAEALSALKTSEENFLSVWSCDHNPVKKDAGEAARCRCRCVGKICMVDIICYLCKEENLVSPSSALQAKVSILLPEIPSSLVIHMEPNSSLIEAIDLILGGAQNLVVPIHNRSSRRKQTYYNNQKRNLMQNGRSTTLHNGHEFCWITQEDIVQYLLSCIGLFSSIASLSIFELGLINDNKISTVHYSSPASEASGKISRSLFDQTSVAVIDDDHRTLIGEISPYTLSCCDEAAAAAIATLSTGELMAYIDCGGPPAYIISIVKERLRLKKLDKMFEEFISFNNSSDASHSSSGSSSSEDDESSPIALSSPVSGRSKRFRRSMSYSARLVRRAEAIVCHPGSSLVAVMIQAIAHRVNYVWVIEEDCGLTGIVTFVDILKVFREHLQEMA